MSEVTTLSSPMDNSSFIFTNDDLNITTYNNSSNDTSANFTDNPGGSGSGRPMFTLPEIPSWVSSLYLSMLCLSILTGVPGNTLTVAAYARIRVKTSCDWYILIVALTDLVSCLFRSPVYIMEYCGVWHLYSNSDLCRFISWMSQTTVCVSIFIFALIAIDRYIKLCHTFRWNISPTRAKNFSLLIIVVNSLIATPCLFIFENLRRGVCNVKVALQQNVLVKGYYSLIFVLFLMMFIAVVFCYINIAIKVRNTRRVGEVTVEATTVSVAKTADDADLTENTQENSVKPVSGGQAGITARTMTTTHHLSLPHRERSVRKMTTTTIATTYQSTSLQFNSRKPRPASADDTPVFILGGDQMSPNSDRNRVIHTGAGFSEVPIHTLPQDSDGGGAVFWNEVFVKSELASGSSTATQMGQDTAPANTRLSEMNRRKAMVRQQRNVRITGLLFVVTVVFILSWVPPYIAMVKGFYIGYSFPFSLGEWLLLSYGRSCYVINTFSNPIIYAAMSATYRRHVQDLAKALWKAVRNIRCRW